MKALVLCVTVSVACLAAGCASRATPPQAPRGSSPGTSPQTSMPAVPDYAGIAGANKRAASDAADHMLALAQLPPGASKTTSTPQAVRSPLTYPATNSLLDHAALWQVALPFDGALAWIDAHPPKGLTQDGKSRGSGDGGGTAGRSYSAQGTYPGGAATQSWGNAWLQVALTPISAGETAIRLDGMAMWLDPKPLRDTANGARLRVTVEGGCPSSDGKEVGVLNTGADLKIALLPAETPTAALVCQYTGLNADAFALERSTRVDAGVAARLAAAVTASNLSHYDDIVRHCPMDDGSATVLVFSYPDRGDVDIWYTRTGCAGISNGFIGAAPSEALNALVDPSASGPPLPAASAAS